MAMPLAIGHLALSRRNPRALAVRPAAARDAWSDRPPIPRGVVTWSDEALPVGAGDPAVAIGGPPSFRPLREASWRSGAPRIENAVFGAVLAAILVSTTIAGIDGARSILLATVGPGASAARTPVVETRVLTVQPVTDTASRSVTASAASGG